MKSIAIINGSKINDGITQGSLALYKTLKKIGYDVKWFQIMDTKNKSEYFLGDYMISGIALPSYTISNGINRLIFLKKKLNSIDSDMIFLSDPTLVAPLRKLSNVIVKFHDFRPLSNHADKFSTTLMFKYIMPKLRLLKWGIFISEFTKSEAINFSLKPEWSFVLPEPSLNLFPEKSRMKRSREILGEEGLTFTYIATDRQYKNIKFFLELTEAFKIHNNARFLLVSKLKNHTMKLIQKKYGNVKVIDNVADIREIYDETDVLLYPSLYDGFGRPIIEAMQFGIPVIVSDIEPFIEITGGNSIRCEPNNTKSWIDQMNKLYNREYYSNWSNLSKARSLHFELEAFEKSVKLIFSDIQNHYDKLN